MVNKKININKRKGKKASLVLAFLLLFSIFSITLISAESPQNMLLQTISDKLSEIKEVLSSMLFKLEQIEAKNTTLNVNVEPPQVTIEPNITITPPEVNIEINPNITLPEKKCLWESYSQTNKLDLINSNIVYISVPQNKLFKEINVTRAVVKARNCAPIIIKVNDIECLSTGGGTNTFFSDLCPEKFRGGLNKIELIGHSLGSPYDCNAELNDIYFEMEVKPDNC